LLLSWERLEDEDPDVVCVWDLECVESTVRLELSD
jgi:hypothetical protein